MEPKKTSKSRLVTIAFIIGIIVGVVLAAIIPKDHFYTRLIAVFIMAFIVAFIPNWYIKRKKENNKSEQDQE
ncbi:MAG: hypothetical protein J6V81_03815 [Bacteroidales bacterium]|nr:hypothetical protein [Bacteroidales bacterium]